jgi:glutaminase
MAAPASRAVHPCISTGQLPDPQLVVALVAETHERFNGIAEGVVADYIPALAEVPPDLFGVCIAGVSGQLYAIGDADYPHSIQSVSKPFVFGLICQAIGEDEARCRLGVNSTGLPFNSVIAVDRGTGGLTNPMVNAGAIAASSLAPGDSAEAKWAFLRAGLSRFAGRELAIDEAVYRSEAAANQRNVGIATLLHSFERIYFDPALATDIYTRQCALSVTAKDLAVMAATLANGGVNPLTREPVIDPVHCRHVLAVMVTAGLYEHSGDWLYDTGLPGKSGVSGNLITVAPGKGGLATFAPRLDAAGNSVKGQLAARFLSEELGFNLFASSPRCVAGP